MDRTYIKKKFRIGMDDNNITSLIERRSYSIREEGTLEDVGLYIKAFKVEKSLTVYLIPLKKKVTIKVIENVVTHNGIEHNVIIVHHLPLTREAKMRIATMSVETFFYSELSYDPVSIIDNPYVVYEHPVKEKDKFQKFRT